MAPKDVLKCLLLSYSSPVDADTRRLAFRYVMNVAKAMNVR